MSRSWISPFAALAGLLIVFSSCERHHVGELPEMQREHLNPLAPEAGETKVVEPTSPSASPTPANFFPNQKP